jgi:hypothetical protein
VSCTDVELAPAAKRGTSTAGQELGPDEIAELLVRWRPSVLRRMVANNFDVKWVMSQVGHADSKRTLDVYAQLEQRIRRDHGAGFDRLVRQARAQLGDGREGPLVVAA